MYILKKKVIALNYTYYALYKVLFEGVFHVSSATNFEQKMN